MRLISTSGFSYADWHGPFYPEGLAKSRELAFFSRYFKAVELNYSFYSPPGQKGIAGHLQKAPGMMFSLKGHRNFTHLRNYQQKDVDIYRSALEQLGEADALVSLLLQFPYSFHATDQNLEYVQKLLKSFEAFPTAVEFRHAKWKNSNVYEFFKTSNTALVTTDAPALKNLYRGGWEANGPFSYVRLHGRNSGKWWEHDEGWERYDYLYNSEEIKGMAGGVKSLESCEDKDSRDVFVFFNNHWQAQGAINALQLAVALGEVLPEELPEPMKNALEKS